MCVVPGLTIMSSRPGVASVQCETQHCTAWYQQRPDTGVVSGDIVTSHWCQWPLVVRAVFTRRNSEFQHGKLITILSFSA